MFQSTHPHGVRPVEILYVQGGERFQSTHPHGVRPPYSIHYDFLLPVSIHAPTRGATGRYLPSGNIQLSFNPRTHTRCDSAPPIPRYRKTGFNPRTHTRCDFSLMIFSASICVSIHAPTRGATGFTAHKLGLGSVSIHAPTRGATGKVTSCGILYSVSIHAPTRGATIATFIFSRYIMSVSIHAPTRGATGTLSVSPYATGSFQSTHPHEVRLRASVFIVRLRIVSIHAPTRGATFRRDVPTCPYGVSIHAPTRGATRLILISILGTRSFNPRTHTRCDHLPPYNRWLC